MVIVGSEILICVWIVFPLKLINLLVLVFVNSDLGLLGYSPEIQIIRIGPVVVGLGNFSSVFG